jgi:predicted SprT family Zn-dependent metalloprotease
MIWCLNIGENYEVSNAMWEEFCESLPQTNITHLYASEHVIDITLKNRMRDYIRENRKKHKKHCSMDNLAVIEKCTHMWWNPINGVKELKPLLPPPPPPPPPPPTPPPTAVQAKLDEWTFKCICGVRCCSKDDVKKHPIGRMYQCSTCDIWCHVVCVYGEALTDDELGKMDDVFCAPCKSIIKYDLSRVPGEWKFKCKCGEVCSHYENPLYHPVGAKYACTECGTFSHVLCMFGQKMSEEDLKKMPVSIQSQTYDV